MNIFRLDNDPRTCAKYHCDRHVVKMPVEYLDILRGLDHPLGRWVWSNRAHFDWLKQMAAYTCEEFLYRYGQIHHCAREIAILTCPAQLEAIKETEQPFINEGVDNITIDIVENYRRIYTGPKRHLCTWSHRLPPAWFTTDPAHRFLGTDKLLKELLSYA